MANPVSMLKSVLKPASEDIYAIPASLEAAQRALDEALTGRRAIDDAITRKVDGVAAAKVEHAQAITDADDAEVRLAVETDASQIPGLEEAATAARTKQDITAKQANGADRVLSALYTRAADADSAITAARQAWNIELQMFKVSVRNAVYGEIEQALQGLVPVLARVAALSAVGIVAWNEPLVQDTLVPGMTTGTPDVIRGLRIGLSNRMPEDLAETWREHPVAAVLGRKMQPLADMRSRAAGHVPFALPRPPAKQPEVSHQNRQANDSDKAIDAREAERLAAIPKRDPTKTYGKAWEMTVGANAPLPTF